MWAFAQEVVRSDRKEPGPICVSLVGGGGKTTLAFKLAHEAAKNKKRVVVTTTTKMMVPKVGSLASNADCTHLVVTPKLAAAVETTGKHLNAQPGAVVVVARDTKMSHMGIWRIIGTPPSWPIQLARAVKADLVVVEADGSRRLPFKAPGEEEPVLADRSHMVIAVAGVDVLGRPLNDTAVFRPKLVSKYTGLRPESPVDVSTVARVIGSRDLWIRNATDLATRPVFVACVNKVDDHPRREQAQAIAKSLTQTESPPDYVLATGHYGKIVECKRLSTKRTEE